MRHFCRLRRLVRREVETGGAHAETRGQGGLCGKPGAMGGARGEGEGGAGHVET